MRPTKTSCLRCGAATLRDPGFEGVKSDEPFCPACDAVWHRVSCVVCGVSYLVDVTRHCDPLVMRRIVVGRKRQAIHDRVVKREVGQRRHFGFRMCHEEER